MIVLKQQERKTIWLKEKYIVGFTYVNKQGLNVSVVEYHGRKNIVVEFEDGERKTTTGSYIKKGLPLHPTFGKVKVGDTFSCSDGEQLKEYREYSKWEMTFIPDIIRQDFGVFED